MMKSKLTIVAVCAALLLVGAQAFAEITIDVTPPAITFAGNGTDLDKALNDLYSVGEQQFADQIAKFKTEAHTELDKYGDMGDLAKGFADANVSASQAATLQGFEGYKLFAVMVGGMAGIQLPSTDPSVLTDLSNTLADDPDVRAGVAPSISVNVGFHLGKILGLFNSDLGDKTKRIYVNIKGGAYNGSYDTSDNSTFDMKTSTFGIGVNYQLFTPKNVAFGLFKWRGLSVGSGLTYQRNTFGSSTTLDPIVQTYTASNPVTYGGYTVGSIDTLATLTATPKVDIGVDMRTYSIPLEVLTSVQLLYVLNVNAGLGADIVFGKSDITATSSSTMDVTNLSVNGTNAHYTSTPGSVAVDASTTDIKPTLARARVMGGLGINAGPIKLDVPMYYYFSSGFGAGMSVGFVW
ncbi:MAG TPA: hypothetical protein PKO22_11020 [Treponemataceae bacterium]|nr:hypothetical protein [Treponemataceae bacterium]